jgi:hypothetical protein
MDTNKPTFVTNFPDSPLASTTDSIHRRSDHAYRRLDSKRPAARREWLDEKGLRPLEIRQSEEVIIQRTPRVRSLGGATRIRQQFGLALHPRFRPRPDALELIEMDEGCVDLSQFGGALGRTEQNRWIGMTGLQSLLRNREGGFAFTIPPQGFTSLDIEFGRGGILQGGPIVFEPAWDGPQLQPHPRPRDQGHLIVGIFRKVRIECHQRFLESPEPREGTAHERPGGMSTRCECLDPLDFVETRLPLPVLDVGRGKPHPQVDVPGSHQKLRVQIRDDVMIGTVTAQRGHPDRRNQKENPRDP